MRWYDVVVVGGGFGGVAAAREAERRLAGRGVRAVLVAPENFLLFSPLLPEAASGTLEPRHAVIPLRDLLRRTDYLPGEVTGLDAAGRAATVRDVNGEEHELRYHTLVLAPGSVPTTLPIPGLVEHAVGFKTLPDAIWLRNRVLRHVEAAGATGDPGRRRELLTFTFVGGGYAGVEALAELESLVRDVRRAHDDVAPGGLRWVLVEAAGSLLPGLDPRLARYTERVLRARGVEVRLGTRLVSCEGGRVVLSDERIAPYRSGTIVWTAGQRPSPLPARAGLPVDDRGRVPVDRYLRVEGHADVYAVGDCAAVPVPEGGIAPMTAQHAWREGAVCGRNVAADHGAGEAAPFTYRTRGLAVTLGKHRGAAQVRRLTFRGPLAWWMGRTYHLLMMPGLGRKARVVTDWTYALLFPRDTSQLGSLGRPAPLAPPAGGDGPL